MSPNYTKNVEAKMKLPMASIFPVHGSILGMTPHTSVLSPVKIECTQ